MTLTKLPTAALGRNGPQIPRIGFGAMGLSSFYGSVGPKEERLAFLDRVYEAGEVHWDSSDIYGDSEELIGEWFKRTGKRDQIFLATKFGVFIGPEGMRDTRNEPEYVKEAVEKSLKRLQTDHIDLYYCHRLSGKVPIEDTVGAMAELVKAGKVKYLGLSECSAASLRRAHKVHPISAVQMEYSPFAMDIEDPKIGLLKACRELGVAVVAYSPLGRGLITGQIKSPDDFEEGDFRRMAPRYSKENFPNNVKMVEDLKDIAARKKCTTGQIALAWLLAQGDDIFPIPGTRKDKYLEENLGAAKVKLTEAENEEIRKLIEKTEVKGTRYPESFMSACFADTPEK